MTPQEAAKNDFDAAHKAFKEMARKKSESLEKWVIEKGGELDKEGCVRGLSPENDRIFEWKNYELTIIQAEIQTMERYEKSLRQQIAELTHSNALLKVGKSDENMSFISDKQVRENADFYYFMEVSKDTSKLDFRRNLNQMRKWIDEAQKRMLLGEDEEKYIERRNKAVSLLADERALKNYFDDLTKKYFLGGNQLFIKIKPF